MSVECQKFQESWVSEPSHQKWSWAIKIFEEFRKSRNEAVLRDDCNGEPLLDKTLDEILTKMSTSFWLDLSPKYASKMAKSIEGRLSTR